jgi:hypothetical protein
MIVPIRKGQPEMRVLLRDPGGDGCPLTDFQQVRLEISAPAPEPGFEDSPIIKEGCWPGYGPDFELPLWDCPRLVYPAFETADDCVVFRFDRLLERLPPGRYVGTILYINRPVAWLDLDLRDSVYVPERVLVSEEGCR